MILTKASTLRNWLNLVYFNLRMWGIPLGDVDDIKVLCDQLESKSIFETMHNSLTSRMSLDETKQKYTRLDPWDVFKYAVQRDEFILARDAIALFDRSLNPGVKHLVLQGPAFWAGIPTAYAFLLISNRYEDLHEEGPEAEWEEGEMQLYGNVDWEVVADAFSAYAQRELLMKLWLTLTR